MALAVQSSSLDLEHFAAFARTLRLDNGERAELKAFQRLMLADYFDGTKESLILLPKKNGKTTIIAALTLHHLCYTDYAEAYIAASSRDQATLLYNAAKKFVTRSPALQKRLLVRKGTREIRSRRDDGFLRVLAADADTADGVGPTLAILDELHRFHSDALYGVFADGLDARDGQMITISTAGADEEGPLGRMRANAVQDVSKVKVDGVYRVARDPEASFVMHEWALQASDDLDDLELVKQANPLLTIPQLRRRKKSPSMTASRWARFACNVWAQSDSAAINALDWGPCAQDYTPLVKGTKDVVIGVDVGWKRDTTALVPVGILNDEQRSIPASAFYDEEELPDVESPDLLVATFGVPRIIPAPGDGTMTPDAVIKQACREMDELYPEARWAIDPNADAQHLAQWIEDELCDGDDERVIEHSQQPAPMCDAAMGLSAQIRAVAIRQPNDAGFNAQVLAAVDKWHGEKWRFEQPRATQRNGPRKPIDSIIAGCMGLRVLRAPTIEKPVPFAFSI